MTPSLEYLLPSFIFTQNCCLDRWVYLLEPYFAKFHINVKYKILEFAFLVVFYTL